MSVSLNPGLFFQVYFCAFLSLFSARYFYAILLVYPETKGVPLEEMDAVFGEGNVEKDMTEGWCLRCSHLPDEQEARLDNESERTSLVSSPLPTNHQAISSSRSRRNPGWFSRLLSGKGSIAGYERIASGEE